MKRVFTALLRARKSLTSLYSFDKDEKELNEFVLLCSRREMFLRALLYKQATFLPLLPCMTSSLLV